MDKGANRGGGQNECGCCVSAFTHIHTVLPFKREGTVNRNRVKFQAMLNGHLGLLPFLPDLRIIENIGKI